MNNDAFKPHPTLVSPFRFVMDRMTGLLRPAEEHERADAIALSLIQRGLTVAHEDGFVREYVSKWFAHEQEDMTSKTKQQRGRIQDMTSKTKQQRGRIQEEQRRRSFQAQVHRVTRGKVVYAHLGAKINERFFDPAKVVLLTSDAACGHCPLSLLCLTQLAWHKMLVEWAFFHCARCQAVAFVNKTLPHMDAELFVCTLLRGNRQMMQWQNTREQRRKAQEVIDRSLNGDRAFRAFSVFGGQEPMFSGDIPFACITRCRDAFGELDMKTLDAQVDCRTTITNAVASMTRY